ncbi:hypothetical protein N7457_000470 [Penicillium paradoxum]|uniref:uncharacterized protein n=1 Tax=Penicillium paradoxum TaxID=176176 RepID=UPI002548683D|nr:uncharacterized protein N7457_000470 [Penicillium paradoxum]KAJ5793871.1 hypothetical protein N7457_000470 [Penicillium paradoxum]
MSKPEAVKISFWEKVDLPFLQLSVYATMMYAAVTGVFRGKASPKRYDHYIVASVVRKLVDRSSSLQAQYAQPGTSDVYTAVMKKRGLDAETVQLPHDTEGHWLGNKNAKKVIVYYHGGGFALPCTPAHVEFWLDMIRALNDNGHDLAVFFPRYTFTPHATYPTQLRQAVEALRYVLSTGRAPGDVIIGGDSAGGNLATATLLHLTHPHPEIEPVALDAPLAGVFAYAPWVNFSTEWPSMKENQWKDIITPSSLKKWSKDYLGGEERDNWNEPLNAPEEWWVDVKTEKMLFLVGSDEILLSPIEVFANKVKGVFPETTVVVAEDESHDAPFYTMTKEETKSGIELRKWLGSRL